MIGAAKIGGLGLDGDRRGVRASTVDLEGLALKA